MRFCFIRGRIAFLDSDGSEGSPGHGACFFYIGRRVERFRAAFRSVGYTFLCEDGIAEKVVARLMAMHKFCDTRSMPCKTHADLHRDPPVDYMRFCFADPAHADAFVAAFGGERITVEPHK
jgi:hypothetical protein